MKQNDDGNVSSKDDDEDDETGCDQPDDDECDTTRDEDYEDFTEEGIQFFVDVMSPNDIPPSTEEFESEIVPELKTTVVQHVLDQSGGADAFPCEDLRLDISDLRWDHAINDENVAKFACKFKYSQKMKKTIEPFVYAFARILNDEKSSFALVDNKKKFMKNGKVFKIRRCARIMPSRMQQYFGDT